MKAVIMAGGEGTRLRPLTSLRPKPMVPIVNQPVMEHILGLVKHHGITEIIATLAFMPGVIQDYFGAGEEWGVEIQYTVEETPLGTAGSVKNAAHLLDPDEPFLVISGDALTDVDLTQVMDFHKSKGGAVTIALKRVDDPLDRGEHGERVLHEVASRRAQPIAHHVAENVCPHLRPVGFQLDCKHADIGAFRLAE